MSSGMRVLVTAFGTVPGPNPHSNALIGMAQALHAELDLITIKASSLAHQGTLGRARLFRVRVQGDLTEQQEAFARAIQRQLQAEHYDIVHVRGALEGQAVIESFESEHRLIYEVAAFAEEGSDRERAWSVAHLRCLERADLVLVGAEAAARALGEHGFAGKVAWVPPGVDVDLYDWWPAAQSESLRVLYLGRFTSDRDIATMLSGVRQAAQRVPIELMMAGEPDPDLRAQVRRLVHSFDLDEIVTVRGEPRPLAIPSMIAAADAAVVPAAATPRFRELGDLPEPLLEYLASRRPIVAAAVPAVSEIIRDEQEGLLYMPGDETSMADAFVSLATDTELRSRLVDAAYARVRQNFSSGARRRRIAELYEMLVPGSQQFDAWTDAFDDGTGVVPITGLVEIPLEPTPFPNEPTPTLRLDHDTSEITSELSPEEIAAQALAVEEPSGSHVPITASITQIDTSPGVNLDDD